MGSVWAAAMGVVGQATGGTPYSAGDVWTAAIGVGGIVLAGLGFIALMAWRLGKRYADRTDGRLDRQSRRQERLEGRVDRGLGQLTIGGGPTASAAKSQLENLKLGDF